MRDFLSALIEILSVPAMPNRRGARVDEHVHDALDWEEIPRRSVFGSPHTNGLNGGDVNPATGLPMVGSLDVGGNPFGVGGGATSCKSVFDHSHDPFESLYSGGCETSASDEVLASHDMFTGHDSFASGDLFFTHDYFSSSGAIWD